MLECAAEGLTEVAGHVEGGICILYVVVGQLLALKLTGKGKGVGAGRGFSEETGALVGVLAVAQALLEVVFQEEFLVQPGLLAHIRGYHYVVLGSVGICFGGEFESGAVGGASVGAAFLQDSGLIGRVADYGHVLPVLGCAAYH